MDDLQTNLPFYLHMGDVKLYVPSEIKLPKNIRSIFIVIPIWKPFDFSDFDAKFASYVK